MDSSVSPGDTTTVSFHDELVVRGGRHPATTPSDARFDPDGPTHETVAPFPGEQLGRYLLLDKIAQGMFGVIFRAHDVELDRDVALKVLHPDHANKRDIVGRFLQEANAAARVVHPGVVTILDCGQYDGGAYIAMDLLDGESLTDRLETCGRLLTHDAVEIARQIAAALEATHAAGILHRDLKPDNIFVVTDPVMPDGSRVKILDFGLAKILDDSAHTPRGRTRVNTVFGTPRYMSPEQCRSSTLIDHRADIYSLGCILFELVTGRPPYDGDIEDVLEAHLTAAIPRASTFTGCSPHLDELIGRLMAKDPARRPPTMTAVRLALDELPLGRLGSTPLTPPPARTPLPPKPAAKRLMAIPSVPRLAGAPRVPPPLSPTAAPVPRGATQSPTQALRPQPMQAQPSMQPQPSMQAPQPMQATRPPTRPPTAKPSMMPTLPPPTPPPSMMPTLPPPTPPPSMMPTRPPPTPPVRPPPPAASTRFARISPNRVVSPGTTRIPRIIQGMLSVPTSPGVQPSMPTHSMSVRPSHPTLQPIAEALPPSTPVLHRSPLPPYYPPPPTVATAPFAPTPYGGSPSHAAHAAPAMQAAPTTPAAPAMQAGPATPAAPAMQAGPSTPPASAKHPAPGMPFEPPMFVAPTPMAAPLPAAYPSRPSPQHAQHAQHARHMQLRAPPMQVMHAQPMQTLMHARPMHAQAMHPRPMHPRPMPAYSLPAQPLDTQPLDTQPLDTQPLDTQPFNTQPLDTQPLHALHALHAQPMCAQPIPPRHDQPPSAVGYAGAHPIYSAPHPLSMAIPVGLPAPSQSMMFSAEALDAPSESKWPLIILSIACALSGALAALVLA